MGDELPERTDNTLKQVGKLFGQLGWNKKFTEFEKEKLVCIVEETHHKFLAVGKAMVSSSELETMEKGEVIQNIHYISDKFWETGKTIYD